MSDAKLKVDLAELDHMTRFVVTYVKNHRYLIANAMERAAPKSKNALAAQLKQKFPTSKARTFNAPFNTPKRVNHKYLNTWIGLSGAGPRDLFLPKEGGAKNSPAWYLFPNIRGGGRPTKTSEDRLRRKYPSFRGKYIVPTGAYPVKLNSKGNVSGGGGKYVTVLSRLKAFNEAGFKANVSKSKRSSKKRTKEDYFLGAPGAGGYSGYGDLGIQARVGSRPKGNPGGRGRPVTSNLPRGFHTVFYITEQPQYDARFNLPKIVWHSFSNNYNKEWKKQIAEAMRSKG